MSSSRFASNQSVAGDLPFKSINHGLKRYGGSLRGKVCVLEGIISAGKSTAGQELTKYVEQNLGIKCRFFPEPLIQELLDLFLSDQKKYAYVFQMTMLMKRLAIYREASELAKQGYFCIIDRGLYGDYCFALMHKNKGNISDSAGVNTEQVTEWKAYLAAMHAETYEHPDYVIYLEVDSDTAIKRCRARDRQGEKAYTKEYFDQICSVYSNVIQTTPTHSFITVDWKENRPKDKIVVPLLEKIKAAYDACPVDQSGF
jgi:deoxyadenosine/deoxycytidine kinase